VARVRGDDMSITVEVAFEGDVLPELEGVDVCYCWSFIAPIIMDLLRQAMPVKALTREGVTAWQAEMRRLYEQLPEPLKCVVRPLLEGLTPLEKVLQEYGLLDKCWYQVFFSAHD